jgi:MFS family permease
MYVFFGRRGRETWADLRQIGNAESAHFTADIGLDKGALNTAVALFFAFFVTLQPLGAALGRRYGMVLWVPSCMILWGVCTALHAWVRHRWQLYTLRILIGCLEGMEDLNTHKTFRSNTLSSRILSSHRHLPLPLLYAIRIRQAALVLLRPGSSWRRSWGPYKLSRVFSLRE